MIEIEQNNPASMYLYVRGRDEHGDKKALVLQWLSRRYGSQQLLLDTLTTKNQTVVIHQDEECEIVLELRPRRLTPAEKIKMIAELR